MVKISTFDGSPAATMSRVASMPSRPGIRTSMSTTSGRSAEHMDTAVAPSPASPTTAISLSASRISRKPFLIRGWSSASSTVITMRPPVRAEPGTDPPAPRITRAAVQLTAGRFDPLAHPGQAAACGAGRGGATGAVVLDVHAYFAR